MAKQDSLRRRLLADESRAFDLSVVGRPRVAVGYPSTYHVAMSSLSFQWVLRLTAEGRAGFAVERFFAEPGLAGRSFETATPLGNFDLLAWSLSFETDAVDLLRTLDAAGIPRARRDRCAGDHPLLVVGGPVATINPLPLAPAIDLFVLGAAERLWPAVLDLVAAGTSRERLLEELASREGYLVPAHHLDGDSTSGLRLRRLERHDHETAPSSTIPASWIVTPHTEYRGRGLVEMSRGCPEKCRYCWASYSSGRLRCYPTAGLLDRVRELSRLTDRVGFVATAVGDHPDLAEILEDCLASGIQPSVSSLRIPAMRPEILRLLASAGARSVTIAPEAGSDGLRSRLGKDISTDGILEAVAAAQSCGLSSLKMYFIVGLPGETDDDLDAIGDLLRASRSVMDLHGRRRGRAGELRATLSLLVPKPYTPYRREPMLDRREARRRVDRVVRGARGVANLGLNRPSHREALWQGMLARGDARCYPLLVQAADGRPLASLLREHWPLVEELCLRRLEHDAPGSVISSAPRDRSSEPGSASAGPSAR